MTVLSAQNDGLAIHAEGVCRYYTMGPAEIRAVEGVTLDVPAGQFLALLGSSGSGKSTFLNLLAGLDRPTAGTILVHGKDLARMSPLELAFHRRQTVGMVFQAFNLIPKMTLEENVELPLRFAEVERRERQSRVREVLERVGLSGRLTHRPGELSGGQQQRVAIARALVTDPEIIFADEPTGNLDSRTSDEILQLIREINRSSGATVVMVTHDRALAECFAQRVVTISDGKLVSNGSVA